MTRREIVEIQNQGRQFSHMSSHFFFQNGISLLVQKAFEENCVGDFTTEIMTLLYSIHLYFSGLLGSSTLVLLTTLVIGNQNQNHLKFLFERVV